MIARTLPSLDQKLGAVSSAPTAAGDTAGATPFDQLMALLTPQQPAPLAGLQPGKITPVDFTPAAFNAQTPSAVPAALSPELPLSPGLPVVKAEAIAVSPEKSESGDDATPAPAIAAEAPSAAIAQPAPDAAAIMVAAGIPAPAPLPVAPAKAGPAAEILSPAILQTVLPQPTPGRPAKVAKNAEFSPVSVTAEKPAAAAFTLETTIEAEQPLAVETLLVKAEAAPVILLHKQTQDAIALPATAAVNDIATTHAALASQSLETRLDVARDAQWIDRAAKDIAQLANGEGRLRFRLDPDHLGSLQIDMANGADGLSMRVTTETEAARVILADAQPRLIAEARAQGVRIAESHIDLGQQSSGGGRNAPQEPIIITRSQTFESDTAETNARQSNERFA